MNRKFDVELYGGSHERAVGVRIYGVPAGTEISCSAVQKMLARRSATDSPWSTPRKEADVAEFISGVSQGVADGGVIVAEIKNSNVKSSDYSEFSVKPRPSHADYVSVVKYGKAFSGGGKFSGRMTAGLCIAGAIAKTELGKRGITVKAYVSEIGGVHGKSYKDTDVAEIMSSDYTEIYSLSAMSEMSARVSEAKRSGDSVGGRVECVVNGMPVGIGDAFTGGIESEVAYWLYGVPGVKGVEFGLGFGFAEATGSGANDAFRYAKDGRIVTQTNNSGGINGGISNGMPITVGVALRPTPSISIEQRTVDLSSASDATLSVKGRHDACIVPRAVAPVESAVACAVYALILSEEQWNSTRSDN